MELIDKINTALAQKQLVIPDGHKIAVIISGGTNGAQAALGYKINNDWHFGIVTDWNHVDGVSAGLQLEWSK